MNAAVRQLVRDRACDRCEYCQMRQIDEPLFRYQIEHVIAKQHSGSDDDSNLALACPFCNSHKGPNIAGIDSSDGTMVALFNPRRQIWSEHFARVGFEIIGLTPVGRATVQILNMNDRVRMELRAMIQARGDQA